MISQLKNVKGLVSVYTKYSSQGLKTITTGAFKNSVKLIERLNQDLVSYTESRDPYVHIIHSYESKKPPDRTSSFGGEPPGGQYSQYSPFDEDITFSVIVISFLTSTALTVVSHVTNLLDDFGDEDKRFIQYGLDFVSLILGTVTLADFLTEKKDILADQNYSKQCL